MKTTIEKVRISDIARVAGVSIATVSNVLNGRKQVESEAGKRVLAIARQMGYMKKRKTQLSKSIRLIVYKKHGKVVTDTPFFDQMFAGIERECQKNQFELVISYAYASDVKTMEQLFATLHEENRPVLLLATEMSQEDLEPFDQLDVPLLILDSHFDMDRHDSISINNYESGYLAAMHLVDFGHRHIGFITSSLTFNNMLQRQSGFEDGLSAHNLSLKKEDIFYVEPTMEGAFHEIHEILTKRTAKLPTAFFAANDILAFGAARALKSHGIHLPDEVSLIGMDDMPFCLVVNPMLSTIRVPKEAIGSTAVRRLIQMAESPDQVILKTQVSVSLIERDSVARL